MVQARAFTGSGQGENYGIESRIALSSTALVIGALHENPWQT